MPISRYIILSVAVYAAICLPILFGKTELSEKLTVCACLLAVFATSMFRFPYSLLRWAERAEKDALLFAIGLTYVVCTFTWVVVLCAVMILMENVHLQRPWFAVLSVGLPIAISVFVLEKVRSYCKKRQDKENESASPREKI